MTSSSPLYVQLKMSILEFIENELQYNDKIPSESELMEKYCISRTTVRKAIDELVREGKLYKKQGVGTFVAGQTVEQGLLDFTSCTYGLKQLGISSQYTVLEAAILPARVRVASNLKINVSDEVFRLQRITHVEGVPLNVTKSYIPYQYVKNIEHHDFAVESLYSVLKESYHLDLVRSIRSVEAILCSEELSEKLGIPEGSAILKFAGQVTGRMPNGEEKVIEFFKTYYRTDKIKFYISQNADIHC